MRIDHLEDLDADGRMLQFMLKKGWRVLWTWIHLAVVKVQCWAFVNSAMNRRVQ
jgi:hypothetical protein